MSIMIAIESAGITDVGQKRTGNEDAFYLDDDLKLYMVADGMGGHLAGEVASALVVDTIRDYMKRFKEGSDVEEMEDTDETLSKEANRLLSSITLANQGVHQVAQSNEDYKGMGSTVSAIAYTSPTAGTRDLKFIVDLVAPDYDYSDGLSLTFPPEIVINSAEDAVGNVYGSTYEPVVDTDANTVVWGAPDITEDGDFSGGEVFTVNVETPTLPLDVDYWVFDDGWAAAYCADNPADCDAWGITDPAVVHSEGICTITEEALAFKTEKYWNLKDVTTGEILFEDQAILNGVDIYTGETWDPSDMRMVHGFRPNVSVGYAAPLDFESAVARNAAGEEYDTDTYDFGSYAVWFGYETALAADTYPDSPTGTEGSSDILLLQKDLEFRFTGVYDDSVEHASGLMLHPIKPGTGSIATFVGFRNYDIDLHPMADDVSTARGPLGQFLIRVPFEVWDVESVPAVLFYLIMIDLEVDPQAT